jgi:hypothetical protein
MEHLSAIIWGLVDLAAVSIVTYVISVVKNHNSQIKSVKKGMMWIQHNMLLDRCKSYLKAREITVDELENLTGLYESYKELGGNGTIKKLYEKIQNLPIVDDDE